MTPFETALKEVKTLYVQPIDEGCFRVGYFFKDEVVSFQDYRADGMTELLDDLEKQNKGRTREQWFNLLIQDVQALDPDEEGISQHLDKMLMAVLMLHRFKDYGVAYASLRSVLLMVDRSKRSVKFLYLKDNIVAPDLLTQYFENPTLQ